MDYFIIIGFLILNFFLLCNQLFDNIGKILRQRLPYLGTGIFRGNPLYHLHQPVQGNLVPVVDILLFPLGNFQFFLRVINQGCQSLLVLIADGASKFFINLSANRTGTVFQHMVKLLIFPVYIRQKMFCPLRQV